MNRTVFLVCVALAAVAGFLAGRASVDGFAARSDTRPDYAGGRTERRLVELPADEVAVLRRKAQQYDENERRTDEKANRSAEKAAAEGYAKPGSEQTLAPGTRRPDGTIVGGASWSPMTRTMAIGFLDSMMTDFFAEANVTEDQKQRLKAEMEKRISEGMQVSADFVNGDMDGDAAYDALQTMLGESRKLVDTVLDDQQREVYGKFERGLVGFIHGNVVNIEMANLRTKLGLDPEQAKNVRAIVETRYSRISDRFHAPIPNMFFRPIRRDADADIYAQTAADIREYLRPEQAAAFDTYEATANDALSEYRNMLVPKSK